MIGQQNPENTFWKSLDQEITEISKRTRKNPTKQLHQSKHLHHTPANLPHTAILSHHTPSIARTSVTSTRFQAEFAWHKEQNETLAITNRLKFISISKQKQEKAFQYARRKYELMMKIRENSINEKEMLKKKKTQFEQQSIKINYLKVSKTKEDRSRTSYSMLRKKHSKEKEAQEVRNMTLEVESGLKKSKELQILSKRKLVEKKKENMIKSRTFFQKMQKQKTEMAKSQHKSSIEKQLLANQMQQRRNSYLRKRLEQSIDEEERAKRNLAEHLQSYVFQQ